MSGYSLSHANRNLSALIGSRICHDLIGPVGAITNGLELLSLSGVPEGPEMTLVQSSAAGANARIRFLRIAFGLASAGQMVSEHEVHDILDDVYTAKIKVRWAIPDALDRRLTQAGFLGLLCVESIVPYGGDITVTHRGNQMEITARSDRSAAPGIAWAYVSGTAPPADLAASDVQFALLPALLETLNRAAEITQDDTCVTLRF